MRETLWSPRTVRGPSQPCAGADRPSSDSPQKPDSPAAFLSPPRGASCFPRSLSNGQIGPGLSRSVRVKCLAYRPGLGCCDHSQQLAHHRHLGPHQGEFIRDRLGGSCPAEIKLNVLSPLLPYLDFCPGVLDRLQWIVHLLCPCFDRGSPRARRALPLVLFCSGYNHGHSGVSNDNSSHAYAA
jgi:hypothetical protein